MGRRMVNSELFRNVELGDCEPIVRLLYIGMVVNADDEGRMRAHPKYLRAAVFPFDLFDDAAMVKMRDQLLQRKLILLYEVDGVEYLQHPKWDKWQILRKDRMKSSDCPSPRNQAATICQPGDNQKDNSGCITEVNRTEPKLTEPNPKEEPAPPPKAFELIWADYPRKLGKDAAARHFKAQVRTLKDYLDIANALARFKAKIRKDATEEKFIPHGSTWFNHRWKDWITYTEAQHEHHGDKGIHQLSDFSRRALEAQGLRKAGFPGPTGALLERIRNDQTAQKSAEKPDRTGHRKDGGNLE